MGAKPSSEAAEPDHFVDSGDDISVRDGNFSDAGTEITDPMDLQPHPPAEDDTPTCLAQRMTIVSSKSCRARRASSVAARHVRQPRAMSRAMREVSASTRAPGGLA